MSSPRKSSLYFDYPRYPFVAPPELAGQALRHRVAIVGGGPVGLACALELARFGIASVVIEDDDTVADGSRAVCVARRSMEILQGLGVADRFADKGLAWTGGRSFYRDAVVFELSMPHDADDRFWPMLNLQQCYMEQFLVEAAEATGLVEIRWQSRVAAVRQDGADVELAVETPEGRYTLAADYAIAADGARSAMRQLMGLKLAGTSYQGVYLIADIKMDSRHPIERRAWFDPPSNPGSTVLMHKQPDDIWRVDYQILGDDAEAELQENRIRARIQQQLDMVGETASWALDWYSLYKAHCRCLDSYRHGRVLFVGDAAHLVPIFGVRGLNSGFADANNLGWKLAWVLQGRANDDLLDSYSDERRAATLEIFRQAGKSTRFMTPPTRGYALLRQAALELAIDHVWPRGLIDPRQSAPYDYADSALNSTADDGFAGGPAPGAPLPNARLEPDGNRPAYLLDRLGAQCTLLYFAGDGAVPAALADLAAEAPACRATAVARRPQTVAGVTVLADTAGHVHRRYAASPGDAYLARPDGHVTARWQGLDPARIRAALARIAEPRR